MCYSVTGWLKRHLEYIDSSLDGGNREQYISLLRVERGLNGRRRRC